MNKTLKLKFYITCLALFSLLTACSEYGANKQIDEGAIENGSYTSGELGWTMQIPNGWNIVSKESTQKLSDKGRKAIEDTLGEKVDASGTKNLLSFSKNQFNMFQSTSEPFEIEYDGEWEENNRAIKEIILTTYKDQNIQAEATEISIEKVGGLDFEKYEIDIFGPNGKIILNQLMYSRLINGYDFGININSNNLIDKNTMLAVWLSSSFDVKE